MTIQTALNPFTGNLQLLGNEGGGGGGGVMWIEASGVINAVTNKGYFISATSNIQLPPSASLQLGSTLIIYVDTTDIVTITANGSQFIQYGESSGVSGGTLTSTVQGSVVQLVFRPNDATWHTVSSEGTWSLQT
jgi:hypothetical protein